MFIQRKTSQVTIEYFILFMVVTAVVLLSISQGYFLKPIQSLGERFFYKVTNRILK